MGESNAEAETSEKGKGQMKVELTDEAKEGLMLMLEHYEELAQAVVTTHELCEYVAKRLKKVEAQVAKLDAKDMKKDTKDMKRQYQWVKIAPGISWCRKTGVLRLVSIDGGYIYKTPRTPNAKVDAPSGATAERR